MNLHSMVLIAHVLISAFIIGLVLLQRGKGADAGAAFGSGASGTVFGAKGSANFLSRSTAVLATLFFISSLGLAYLGSQRPVATSLMDEPVEPEVGLINALPPEEQSSAGIDELPGLPTADEPAGDDLPALPDTESIEAGED
jgi:preprotein translocase subunit SecG